jgi:hypothetical protein
VQYKSLDALTMIFSFVLEGMKILDTVYKQLE